MSLLQRACKTLGVFGLIAVMPALVFGQSSYLPQAGEYFPAGSLPGDQLHPALSLGANGGFLVWQDNITDGSGYGISAQQLDSSQSPKLSVFRVNYTGTNDQENPKVALLKNGGAVFVWQGGRQSFQHIYARFLTSSNTWVTPTNDVMVNTVTNHYQVNPAIAVLTNGNVIVTWTSYGQDNADGLQGVYAQILSPTGQKIGGEFLINQFTPNNQRSPAVAAFGNGNFIIAWVSELERASQSSGTFQSAVVPNASVDIYARMFSSSGTALGNEFLVNTDSTLCSSPAIAVASDGTFMITWCEKDLVVLNNGWDIFARPFSSSGNGGVVQRVNSQQYGDQYSPKIASLAADYMVVWTSMGQDGSREGVFGQILNGDASHAGGEFRVNTTVLNQQIHPAVASDGSGHFLVAWSSFVGGIASMDLNAQRYATTSEPLSPPGPPIVSAVGSNMLSVTWPPLAGFSVDHWELYADGSGTPSVTTNLYWSAGPYAASSTHSFQLAYVLTDSHRSPLSTSASGQTWGLDANNDGLPDNWQALYWGTNSANWPSPNTLLRPGGPTVLQVFLWGANPLDPSTWLTQTITQTSQGLFLSWNTHAGYIYQVQTCTDAADWGNLGEPRYAAGTTDSIYLGVGGSTYARYRIIRLVN